METGSVDSDKAIGISMAFGILTILAALLMFGGDTQLLRAWGFAAAMITAGVSVIAVQIYS